MLLYFLCKVPLLLEGDQINVSDRISNASPFIEDETQQIRERILHRKIDWDILQSKYPTDEGLPSPNS